MNPIMRRDASLTVVKLCSIGIHIFMLNVSLFGADAKKL